MNRRAGGASQSRTSTTRTINGAVIVFLPRCTPLTMALAARRGVITGISTRAPGNRSSLPGLCRQYGLSTLAK